MPDVAGIAPEEPNETEDDTTQNPQGSEDREEGEIDTPTGQQSDTQICRCRAAKTRNYIHTENINDRLKILKDTILIYLFLTSFLPMHFMHCHTPYTRHASPTVPPARPVHVSQMH